MRFLPLLLPLFLLRCTPSPSPTPAFYHWQTRLALAPAERAYLDTLDAQRLYVKFFDVDWEEGSGPAPQATLEVGDTSGLSRLDIVPCVFITNRTVANLSPSEIDALAERIAARILRQAERWPGPRLREVQIDCDWTETTRERYFRLLAALRSRLADGIVLSATIRLHQVRYAGRTGVPPVDRGLLMVYNTGRVGEWNENNSILDPAAVRPYLEGLPTYPLPLDLALPAFAWGAVFRDGALVRLIHGLRPVALAADTARFAPLSEQRFEVRKSTYLDGYYLYRGDRIRLEAVTPADLQATAALLRPYFRGRSFALAFYHLDTLTVNLLPHEALEDVVRILD